MIRASQELSQGSDALGSEFITAMQEKMAEWRDIIGHFDRIHQEVQSLEAIEGLVDELLSRCGQAPVTHWVTDQVADPAEAHPTCPTCDKPLRCVSRRRPLHKTGRFGWSGCGPIGYAAPDTAGRPSLAPVMLALAISPFRILAF